MNPVMAPHEIDQLVAWGGKRVASKHRWKRRCFDLLSLAACSGPHPYPSSFTRSDEANRSSNVRTGNASPCRADSSGRWLNSGSQPLDLLRDEVHQCEQVPGFAAPASVGLQAAVINASRRVASVPKSPNAIKGGLATVPEQAA